MQIEHLDSGVIKCLVFQPKKEEPIVAEISLNTEEKDENNHFINNFDSDMREILGMSNDNPKEILFINMPMPLHEYVLAVNPDMLDNDSEYNFGFIGTTIFGTAALLQTVFDSDQKEASTNEVVVKVLSMDDDSIKYLSSFFSNLKAMEKKSGAYDSIVEEINKVGKSTFIRNIIIENAQAGNVVEMEEETEE